MLFEHGYFSHNLNSIQWTIFNAQTASFTQIIMNNNHSHHSVFSVLYAFTFPAGGGVLRLFVTLICPSISIIAIPGKSPASNAERASCPMEPIGLSNMIKSASLPG